MKKNIVLLFLSIIILFAFPAWSRSTPEEEETEIAAEEPMMAEGKYNEAPMLAELVAKGELPPVDERLPKSPKVVEIIESIGRYGGDLIVFATSEDIFNQDLQGMWGSSLFRNPRSSVGIEMDIAEGYEINDDKTSITIFLREGMKWSDGHPFTSEDIRFAFEDMHFNPQVRTWGSIGIDEVEAINPLTVKLTNREGLGINPLQLSSWWGGYATSFHPAHYLKKWHGDYNPDAEKLAKEEGEETWYGEGGALYNHYWWAPLKDPDKPQVEPWQLDEFATTYKVFSRNPYFWRVDPEGNQLPYVDRLIVQIVQPEVYQLKVTGGESSIAYYNTQFDNLALYKTNEANGDYRVILHPGVSGTACKIILDGWTHKDPAIKELFNNIKFRQALSVALDRDEVNQVIYQGLGVPRAVAPLKAVSYYKEGWEEYYAQYDSAMANKLLDEIGMDKRDSDGFRLRPDGGKFSFIIEYVADHWTPELELYREYFEDVGIRTILKLEDGGMLEERRINEEVMGRIHSNPNQPPSFERDMFSGGWACTAMFDDNTHWGYYMSEKLLALKEELEEGELIPPNWRRLETAKDDELSGRKPDDWYIEMEELLDRWAQTEMGSPEYRELGQQFFDQQVTSVWRIGAVGMVPTVMIAKNKLGNVLPPNWISGFPLDHEYVQSWMDQLYWKE